MSSCLTGSGRAYGLVDLEMLVKSPSLSSTASTITSHSSSSSESGGNSPFTISTRKPRTPRKRPNQIYNEAAALLSTAYPKLFSAKNLALLTKPSKFAKPPHPQSIDSFFLGNPNSGSSSSDLLIPFLDDDDDPGLISEKTRFLHQKVSDSVEKRSPVVEVDSLENLETESMLNGEIEEGIIDSIMGNSSFDNYYSPVSVNLCNNNNNIRGLCYGYPAIGWGESYYHNHDHEWRLLVRSALRHADEGDWWRYPRVDVTTTTSPKFYKTQTMEKTKKKKKKKKKKLLENIIADSSVPEIPTGVQEDEKPNVVNRKPIEEGLMLKLNHDNLLAAWSDRGSPFSDEPPGNEAAVGHTLHAKLAQIDLFLGEREASVLRYKEKRRTRLFSKKIRYQVRKVNADQRPRMKGRFVRRPDYSPFE